MEKSQHMEGPEEKTQDINGQLSTSVNGWDVHRFRNIAFLIIALAISGTAGYLFLHERQPDMPSETYTLVADKISQSAPIAIQLPEEVSPIGFDPVQAIRFSPEIKGSWQSEPEAKTGTFRFLPEEKLAVGTYYLATLDTADLKLEKMFSIDTDPVVLAIFPKQEAEVNEFSKITVMFSRPMVPLSTLSETADVTPPVTITPATEGRFKWITMRTLQFTPTTRLARSSTYRIEVASGMRSVDDVVVPSFSHAFTTRTLNYPYQNTSNSLTELTHSEPIRIYFNQPINLERTQAQITLTEANGVPFPFVASYGTRSVRDEKSGKQRILTDKSILEIYAEKDVHGRKFLWNFNTRLDLTLTGATPLEGDIALNIPTTRSVHIQEVITGINAVSSRSDLVSLEVFDPTGTLHVTTSEDIDLSASRITGKGVSTINYGEKCPESGLGEERSYNTNNCVKIPDRKKLIINFDATLFGLGETSTINFSKLVNTNGNVLSTETIVHKFTTYRKFELIRSIPENNAKTASLKELILCSTNPIAEPTEENFYKQFASNMMLGKWNWNRSYYVFPKTAENLDPCPDGTFHTTVRYGLVPKYAYTLSLNLDDHFGQHLTDARQFTTEDASPLAKGFEHLQSAVLMTPPERTKLTYGMDFMSEIDMTICRVSPQTMLSYRAAPPRNTEGAENLRCIETITKHLTLPDSYATRKYFQVDLRDYVANTIGNYVLVFSNPDYKMVQRGWNGQETTYTLGEQLFEKTYLTVTQLAVGAKQVERNSYNDQWMQDIDQGLRTSFMKNKWPTNLYWVNNTTTLSPVFGAVVTPYKMINNVLTTLSPIKTDPEGIAESPSSDDIVGAVITYGADSAVIANATDALSYAQSAVPGRNEYLYTDRPIYRPGDTVHIKGLSRIGYDAQYELPTGSTTVDIRDAAYEVARTQEVPFNGNGTFEMSFILDTKAPLGYYQISSKTGGYGSFQVEEYVAPQFKVAITPDKEEYLSGDTATIKVDANYYFGVPVESGEVEYRLVAQDYYFDRYHDAYFSFGRSWYERSDGWYGDHYLTSGKIALGKGGIASLSQALDIDKLFTGNERHQSKIVTMHVTVKNENGQSVSSQKSFIVHRGDFYVGLIANEYFFVSGKTGIIKIKTVDVNGKPTQKDNLTLALERVEWKSYKRQEVDGNFYYRTEEVKTPISSVTLDTDRDGNGSHEFTAGEAGQYQFTVSGKDGNGNVVSAQYDIYVSGKGSVEVRPTNNASLELVSNNTDLEVGDTARLVIKSPYSRAKALVTITRGYIYERKVIDITSQLTEFQFIITEKEIPGVSAQVLLLSPDPEIKYGELSFKVGTKNKKLDITVTPNKKAYLPGEDVTLDILVKDAGGNPVRAELSIAVVDMSVLALVGNPKKNLVSFFYNWEPVTIRTIANVKNVLNVAEIPIGTKGGSGGGGDELEKKKRGIFKDTAYWNGLVTTGTDGKALVHLTLPDNLTEWQIESVGITKDTKVGTGYSEFTSRKSIMAVPLKPRFILPGDTFAIGGTIFNESDQVQKLKVGVTAPSLELTGTKEIMVSIEPHSSLSVSFPAKAPESIVDGAHSFTISAKNDTYEDVVTNTFPIERNNTYEFTATAGMVKEANWTEHVYLPKNVVTDRGGLTLSVSATMANVLDSAIQGILIYPYECSEQTASKLRTIAVIKQHAALFGTTTPMLPEKVTIGDRTYTLDEIINIGLAKLYQNEGPDGGVAYYANTRPNVWLTRGVLEAYIDLEKAGYAIDKNKKELSARYLYNWINYPEPNMLLSAEDVIMNSYVLTRMDDAQLNSANIRQKLIGYANNKELIRNGLSTPALAHLAIMSENQKFGLFATNRLFAEFENRSNIDARGTTVGTGGEGGSLFYENSTMNTALAIKAFAEAERETPLLEGYLRAIKNSKTRDGGWASTYNSITVIDALTQYLKWKNEANTKIELNVTLDETKLLDVAYGKMNILDTYATTVPISMMKTGKDQLIQFTKKDLGVGKDSYYYDMSLRYYLPTRSIPARDEGISVERSLYRMDDTTFSTPVQDATQGEVLRGRVIISVPSTRYHVTVEDFIPAGVEIINQRFATEDQSLGQDTINPEYGYSEYGMVRSGEQSWFGRGLAQVLSFGGTIGPVTNTDGVVTDDMYANRNTVLQRLYPTATENHDDRIFAYITELPQGEYVYEYFVRALIPGTYQHLPLVASELYTPETFGRTRGDTFTVFKKAN